MANHNFSFAGGEILTSMGAAWFVSYAYHEKIDKTHKNWDGVATAQTRISSYKRGRAFHRSWLQEILSMNPLRLAKNTIGLSAAQVKTMAKEILDSWQNEDAEPFPAEKKSIPSVLKTAIEFPPAIRIEECPEEQKRKRWMLVCKRQIIFPDFLEKYTQELSLLRKTPGFIHEMTEARGNVSPEVEFCSDNEDPAFQEFKDRICTYLYETKAYYNYPECKMIVDDVQKMGIRFSGKAYTKKSAYISVYYALRFLKLSENNGR